MQFRARQPRGHILETTGSRRKTRDWEQRIGNTYVTYGSGGAIWSNQNRGGVLFRRSLT